MWILINAVQLLAMYGVYVYLIISATRSLLRFSLPKTALLIGTYVTVALALVLTFAVPSAPFYSLLGVRYCAIVLWIAMSIGLVALICKTNFSKLIFLILTALAMQSWIMRFAMLLTRLVPLIPRVDSLDYVIYSLALMTVLYPLLRYLFKDLFQSISDRQFDSKLWRTFSILPACYYILLTIGLGGGTSFVYIADLCLMFVAMVLTYVITVKMMRRAYEMKEKEARIELEKSQLMLDVKARENEALQNKFLLVSVQMRPHFIFNVINSVSQLVKEDPEAAEQALQNFADMLRYTTDNMISSEPIPLARELELVKNYLALEKMRFGDRVRWVFDVEDSGITVPSFILQPLVGNAVKHGITRQKEGGTVYISARLSGETATLTVADDGVGFDVQSVGGRVGLRNTRKRIEQCGGQMTIESGERGTRVTLTVPQPRAIKTEEAK